jgi:periplasmic protein TonB
MMTKKHSVRLANLRLIMILPVFAAFLVFIPSCNNANKSGQSETEIAPPPPPPPPPVAEIDSDTPLEVVDEMPVFKGGDAALIDYIKNNTKYPEPAKVKGTQGKVIVRFAVEADGSIDKVSVPKGVDPELDMEAIRVVRTLPSFEKPGIKDGKAVPVWYVLPINFALQ